MFRKFLAALFVCLFVFGCSQEELTLIERTDILYGIVDTAEPASTTDPCDSTELRLADVDRDGYGDPDVFETFSVCEPLADGFVPNTVGSDDCDDENPDVHPDAEEICNGIDDDCDWRADDRDDDTLGAELMFWRDTDRDGFGDPDTEQTFCVNPGNAWVGNSQDCNDQDRWVFPDDTDGDGWHSCTTPVDCDAGSAYAHPWAAELEPEKPEFCRRDEDGDGYGADANVGPFVHTGSDCDDTNPVVFPGQGC